MQGVWLCLEILGYSLKSCSSFFEIIGYLLYFCLFFLLIFEKIYFSSHGESKSTRAA